ncbi:MAG: GNAT family N-acetyltransferase [Cellulomonas sp.]
MRAETVVELREFALSDAPVLMTWIDGPQELVTWAGPAFSWPLDEHQLAAYAREASGQRRIWTAVQTGSGEAVGHASLRLDPVHASGRLGRVLVAPGARGRGVGTTMLEKVLASAFGTFELDRVELGVFTHNAAAIRLYERLGFVCERVLRDVEHVKGRPWSAMQMGLTKPVPGVHAAI